MHLVQALRPLADFEEAMAALYEHFAKRFALQPDAARLFARLARQEHAHRNLVDYQRRLVRANPRLFADIEIDIDEVHRAHTEAAAVVAAGASPSLDDAVGMALRLETSAAEGHCRNALRAAGSEVADLLDGLAKGDNEHIGELMEFAKQLVKSGQGQPPALS